MTSPANDALADLMDSSWGLSSPRLASQPGKLGAVGGFQVGLPAANQARVGLICLEYKDLGVGFCGALIGRGGKKMCIQENCDVASHRKTKVPVDAFGELGGGQVFIQVPPMGAKLESTAIFLTPRISSDAFDARLELYMSEQRTVDQWTSFFASLEATPNPTSEEKDIIAERFDQAPPVSAFTPRTSRLGKRKADSPFPDPDVEFTFLESSFNTDIPMRLDGGSLAENLSILTQHWSSLVGNTRTLLEMSQHNHHEVGGYRERLELELADVEFATSLVATKVGDRPAALGTDSLFKLAEDLREDLATVQKSVSVLESPELAAAREQQLGLGIAQDILNRLNPFFRLFGLWSRSKDTPGDLLEERLQALESRGIAASPPPPPGQHWSFPNHLGGVGVSAGTNATNQATTSGGGDVGALTERVRFLEAQVKDMQDELTSQSVQIGTATFVSRTQVKAWMDLHQCPPRTCIFFLDALSMLALMHGGSESAKSAAEFASITKKVGYDSTDEALVVTSFNLELPEAFGSLPRSGIAKDSRVLPGLPTFKEWDGGDGYLGLKVELANKLSEFIAPMGQHYRHCLSGEALMTAMEMLGASKLFISDLSTWINTTYQDTRARTMASEKEAWSLISHCVRVIFKLLRDARASGARWTEETRDAQLVWAQFQCHRLMEELRLAQFSSHPALSHVLNLHLQDNVVSRSKYESLEKRVLEIEKVAQGAKKAADKAVGAGGKKGGL